MSISYIAVKHLHITCAGLSGLLFVLRGIWAVRGAGMLQKTWVKVLPHVIDTILLASAVTLAVLSGQYPFEQSWLTAKLLALLAYILLGTIAIKRGRTAGTRLSAMIAALAVFAYIVAVAITKQALPF
ncbi:SirB2 family protein [Undibacterium sp. SXout7W]|uniref:SirB2 family protein n=1 Tax=Undibacterium sp. SXout7W TaxID=3413049 RepID=UPI003BF0DEF5